MKTEAADLSKIVLNIIWNIVCAPAWKFGRRWSYE